MLDDEPLGGKGDVEEEKKDDRNNRNDEIREHSCSIKNDNIESSTPVVEGTALDRVAIFLACFCVLVAALQIPWSDTAPHLRPPKNLEKYLWPNHKQRQR